MSAGLFITSLVVLGIGSLLACITSSEYRTIHGVIIEGITTLLFSVLLILACTFDSCKHFALRLSHDEVIVMDYCLENPPTNTLQKLEREGFHATITYDEQRYDDNMNKRGQCHAYRTEYYIKDDEEKSMCKKDVYEELVKRDE